MKRQWARLGLLCLTLLGDYAAFADDKDHKDNGKGSKQDQKKSESPGAVAYSADIEEKDAHAASVLGVKVGMTTQDVLDRMGGRMPDRREDKNGEVIVTWRLATGDLFQVRFRLDNYVSYAAVQFKVPRPTNDFWLKKYSESTDGSATQFVVTQPATAPGPGTSAAPGAAPNTVTNLPVTAMESAPRLSSSAGASQLTGPDPRLQRQYKVTQTVDRERTVWTRAEKVDTYDVNIGFISTDRKQRGEKFEDWVQFKYVEVDQRELKRFDAAMRPAGNNK